MASTLLRSSPAVRAGLRAATTKPMAAMASTSFVRGKATLPDLPCKQFFNGGIADDEEKKTKS